MTANMHRVISAQRRAVKIGVSWALRVKGHRQCHRSIERMRLLIRPIETIGLSCTDFEMGLTASYLSKSRRIFLPHLHLAPPGGDSGEISSKSAASEN